MTTSLHRLGNPLSIHSEFIVLTFGHSRRSKGALESKKETFQKRTPAGYEFTKKVYRKFKLDKILKRIKDLKNRERYTGPYVINKKEELYQCLKKIKRVNNGRSVVVSGMIDDIDDCLRNLGKRMHTVQYSLGYFGKIERLPDDEILEVTTMCGHHMISTELVKKLAREIRIGRLTTKEASLSMEKLCVCRIFNRVRAEEILERMRKSNIPLFP
jgi:hypothetical protein